MCVVTNMTGLPDKRLVATHLAALCLQYLASGCSSLEFLAICWVNVCLGRAKNIRCYSNDVNFRLRSPLGNLARTDWYCKKPSNFCHGMKTWFPFYEHSIRPWLLAEISVAHCEESRPRPPQCHKPDALWGDKQPKRRWPGRHHRAHAAPLQTQIPRDAA